MSVTNPGSAVSGVGSWAGPSAAGSASLISVAPVPLFPGLWACLGTGASNPYQPPNGFVFLIPFTVAGTGRIDQMAAICGTGGSAGAVIRFGIYQGVNPISGPLTLVQDYGTSPATSAATILSPVSSTPSPLIPGQTYWAGVSNQGAPSTLPILNGVQGWNQATAVSNAPIVATGATGLFISGVTGAFPSTISGLSANNTVPQSQVHMI